MIRDVTVGELVDRGHLVLSDGYRTMRSELAASGYRILRVADIGSGTVRLNGAEFVAENFRSAIGNKVGTPGDVLLTTKGTVGRVAVMPQVAELVVYSPQLCFFRLTDHSLIIPAFLRYWLLGPNFRRQAADRKDNTDMAAYINLADIRSLRITLPNPAEQAAIAEVLGALDDKIAANAAIAATTDQYLAAQFEWSLRVHLVDVIQLSEVSTVNAEVVTPIPGGQLRYVDIASVGVGRYEFPNPMAWSDAPSRARRRIRQGDTLWSTVRPNRRSHALNLSKDPLLVGSTGLAVISPRVTGYAYLYEVTRRPEFAAFLENSAEGTAYPAVSADRVGHAPVPLLNREARDSFESVAAPLRLTVSALSDESRTLAAMRDTLLPHLMSGRLRVRDAEKIVSDRV